jgi:hypothetical protein
VLDELHGLCLHIELNELTLPPLLPYEAQKNQDVLAKLV